MPPSGTPSGPANRASEAPALPCAAVLPCLERLLDAAPLAEARRLAERFPDAPPFLKELARRGWLTNFQVRFILNRRADQLFIGPYLVLEKIGEGGMGAVFKAKRTDANRIVAIKVLHRERNANPDMVRRFRREVEVASSMSHPNVVRALDAVEVEGNLIFEMELIEGINLTQLVNKRGPLPVPMAADFIRQAALGLQHAHEKGLVHRDIKPSNLFVTRNLNPALNNYEVSPHGLIKVLDLGLALIQAREGEVERSRLTQLGRVVGTTDFLAPEQARNSHGVDIRADLYSLGCTFFFLLTGNVPFPTGSPMEKLFKHQFDEPAPLEKLRSGLPTGLVALIRKLMAKRAEDRFQTPGEVAKVLEPFTRDSSRTPAPAAMPPDLPLVIGIGPGVVIKPGSGGNVPAAIPLATPVNPQTSAVPPLPTAVAEVKSDPFGFDLAAAPAKPPALPQPRRRVGLWLVLLLLLLGGAVASGLMLKRRVVPTVNPEPEAKIPIPTLDDLDAAQIPAAERIANQPRELVAVLGEHAKRDTPFTAAVFAPQGATLALLIGPPTAEQTVSLWDGTTGKATEVGKFKGPEAKLSFLSDGQTLACVGKTNLALYRASSRGQDTIFSAPDKAEIVGGVSPTGEYALTLTTTPPAKLSICSLAAKTEQALPRKGLSAAVTKVAYAPDGKSVALSVDRGAVAVDLANPGGAERRFPDLDAVVATMQFSPNGKTLCALARNGRIGVWDTETRNLLPTQPTSIANVQQLCLSSDSAYLAVWGPRMVRLLDLNERTEKTPAPTVTRQLTQVAFAPGKHMLALLSGDARLILWDADAGKVLKEVTFPGPVASISFAADGRHLAAVNANGTVYILRLYPKG